MRLDTSQHMTSFYRRAWRCILQNGSVATEDWCSYVLWAVCLGSYLHSQYHINILSLICGARQRNILDFETTVFNQNGIDMSVCVFVCFPLLFYWMICIRQRGTLLNICFNEMWNASGVWYCGWNLSFSLVGLMVKTWLINHCRGAVAVSAL